LRQCMVKMVWAQWHGVADGASRVNGRGREREPARLRRHRLEMVWD